MWVSHQETFWWSRKARWVCAALYSQLFTVLWIELGETLYTSFFFSSLSRPKINGIQWCQSCRAMGVWTSGTAKMLFHATQWPLSREFPQGKQKKKMHNHLLESTVECYFIFFLLSRSTTMCNGGRITLALDVQ